MRCSFVLATLNLARSDVVVETTHSDKLLSRFPVSFPIPNHNDSISGFACIDLYRDVSTFGSSGAISGPWHQVNSIVIPETSVSINYNFAVPYNGWTRATALAFVGASKVSPAVSELQSFVITPTTNTTGQLIIAPMNPSVHAYDGEIFYATNAHPSQWAVPMWLRLIDNRTESSIYRIDSNASFEPCILQSTETYLFIPEELFRDLLETLRQSGINYRQSRDTNRVHIENIAEEQIENLPIVQFLLRTDNGEQVNIGLLHPREYITKRAGIRNHRELLIRTRTSDSCTLSPLILRKLVIHADARNSRIGFGEPLVEIDF